MAKKKNGTQKARAKKVKAIAATNKPRLGIPKTQGQPNTYATSFLRQWRMASSIGLVYGHVNPFSAEAAQSKVPDSARVNSFVYRTVDRYEWTFGTPSGLTISPSIAEHLSTWTTGPNWSAKTSSASSSNTLLTGATEECRLVSWGVRIYGDNRYDKVSGYVKIMLCRGNPDAYLTTGGDANTSDPNAWVHYQSVPIAALDHYVIPSVIDSTARHTFIAPSYTSTSATSDSWENVIITVAGYDTAAKGVIEIVRNFECVPKMATLGAKMASPGVPSDPGHSAMVSHVKANHPPVVPTAQASQSLWGAIKDAASALGADAVRFVAPRLSATLFGRGPQPMMLRNIGDVD